MRKNTSKKYVKCYKHDEDCRRELTDSYIAYGYRRKIPNT